MKLNARCENCNYWTPILANNGTVQYGECRFNPPNTFIYTAEQFNPNSDLAGNYFPTTKINGWCGKFEKEDG